MTPTMSLRASRLQRRACEQECLLSSRKSGNVDRGPGSARSGVGEKRKVGCMAYKMAGPAVCRQARKAQRRCKDTEGLSWLVRAEGLLVRSGGVEGGSSTTASAAVGGLATLESPLRVPSTAGESRPAPEAHPEMGGGDGGSGNKAPPRGGDGGGGGGWEDSYFQWWENNNPLSRIVTGMKMRAAADPEFVFKICVECGLDAMIIITVNLLTRRDKFSSELEFVFSQIAVSLLNDFALVYLLAATPECSSRARAGSMRAIMAELPSHVFQRSPQGLQRTFTAGSRVMCFAAKAVQYGAVGLVMGTAGSGFVLCLTSIRQALDADFKPPATYQPALGTGLGWAIFMSGSSNVRYNLINFVEDFAQDRFPGPRSRALSILLRLSNNIFGAHSWMHLARKLNLSRPRQGIKDRQAVEEDAITTMPAAH